MVKFTRNCFSAPFHSSTSSGASEEFHRILEYLLSKFIYFYLWKGIAVTTCNTLTYIIDRYRFDLFSCLCYHIFTFFSVFPVINIYIYIYIYKAIYQYIYIYFSFLFSVELFVRILLYNQQVLIKVVLSVNCSVLSCSYLA